MVKGRQYNNAHSMRVHANVSITKMNCDRSTLNLDSRQKRQINVSVTKTNSTAQYRSVRYVYARSTRTRIVCMNVCVLYIALVWRAKRNKNQSATLRALPRNIATWTPQYYAVGVTTSSDSDPVILRGLRQRGV